MHLRRRTANLCTKIPDFRGFDSHIILSLRGGILMSIGNFPERLSQAMLVGIIMLVGRLGVHTHTHSNILRYLFAIYTFFILPRSCRTSSPWGTSSTARTWRDDLSREIGHAETAGKLLSRAGPSLTTGSQHSAEGGVVETRCSSL